MRYFCSAVSIGLGVLVVAAAGAIAAAPGTSGTVPQSAEQSIYRPTISDLMNSVIQPRHIKLWLAAKAQDWPLAEYERHNINGAFSRIAAAIPTDKGVRVPDLIDAFVAPHLSALGKAIKARDPNGFVAAYGALTQGCNGCHQATGHPMVVIEVPAGDVYGDQDFRPAPPVPTTPK